MDTLTEKMAIALDNMDLSTAQDLIDKGANVNQGNSYLLVKFILECNIQVVQFLLDNGIHYIQNKNHLFKMCINNGYNDILELFPKEVDDYQKIIDLTIDSIKATDNKDPDFMTQYYGTLTQKQNILQSSKSAIEKIKLHNSLKTNLTNDEKETRKRKI